MYQNFSSNKSAMDTNLTIAFRKSRDSNRRPRQSPSWRARRHRRLRQCSDLVNRQTCRRWPSTPLPRRTPTRWSSPTPIADIATRTIRTMSATKAWRATTATRWLFPHSVTSKNLHYHMWLSESIYESFLKARAFRNQRKFIITLECNVYKHNFTTFIVN